MVDWRGTAPNLGGGRGDTTRPCRYRYEVTTTLGVTKFMHHVTRTKGDRKRRTR